MFQSLRQANPFYILYKGEKPRCEVGTVVSVSNPTPKFQNQFNTYQNTPEMVVDVKVKVGDNTYAFPQLPASMSVADVNQDGVTATISSSREAINTEVENMLHRSQEIIDSVDYHHNVIDSCNDMLKELNPRYAKEKQQEEDIAALKTQMGGIEGTLQSMQSMLSKALANSTSGGGSNKSTTKS